MNLQLLSHNVQGLNDVGKVVRLRNYLSPPLHSLDIVCLQEHKLRGPAIQALDSRMESSLRHIL